MITRRQTIPVDPSPTERFVGLDVADDDGVSGEVLVSIDRAVWDTLGDDVDAVEVVVTVTPAAKG